jgi:hypothetical protein
MALPDLITPSGAQSEDVRLGAAPVTTRNGRPPAHRRKRIRFSWGFLLRLALLAAFILVAYGGVFYQVATSIADGSRLAYLAVLPLLIVMIALGTSTPQRGVADPESDWILASIIGGFGLLLQFLMQARLPTLAGLWFQQLVGVVIWTGFAATILFGIRRVANRNKWPMWLFALNTATPLPYLMVTEWLGGSNVAASAVAAVIGTIAIFLAGKRNAPHWRLTATAVCAVAGIGSAVALSGRPLVVSVVVSAGVVPLVVFILLDAFGGRNTWHLRSDETPLPHRSPFSLALLAAAAVMLMVANAPHAAALPTPPRANAGWEQRAGLTQAEQFGFIRRYLGPDATFVRYQVPSVDGYPQAVVDVITADNLASLRVYRDVVWYPDSTMPNYAPIGVANPAITDAVATATDASAATSAGVDNWHCVTWVWRVGDKYQQVFVVVDQDVLAKAPPAGPQPLSLHDTVAAPALWMTRQQANPSGEVDDVVAQRAQQIVNQVANAGAPRRD